MKEVLRFDNVSMHYHSKQGETVAVKNMSFSVFEGEFVAVIGPSGCGKSTLLNILGLLDNPTSGSYRIDGVEVAQLKERERTLYRRGKIGFIFQSFNLIEEMTVEENIALPLTYLDYSTAERKKLVEEVMISLNIAHRAKHFPNQLSGGQQQRVAIARAVVTKPGLILADEPTGNLDSKNGRDVMTTLKALNDAGTTIVMVTHSQKDAQYANRVINLFDGLVVDSLKDKM